jgi:hypothetical protein
MKYFNHWLAPIKWTRLKGKKNKMKRPIYVLLITATVMLSNCQATNPVGSQTSENAPVVITSQPTISEHDASNYAVRIAMQSQPEIDASSAAPRFREIKQTSFHSALQEMHTEPHANDILSQSVWLITLSGVWNVGIPGPGITPTPYRTFYVVLDDWGNELRTSLQQ